MFDKAEKYLRKIQLKNKQRVIDRKFEKDGLTDEVLSLQIALNKEKNLYNINDGDYVQ